jgi:hypothetical protein
VLKPTAPIEEIEAYLPRNLSEYFQYLTDQGIAYIDSCDPGPMFELLCPSCGMPEVGCAFPDECEDWRTVSAEWSSIRAAMGEYSQSV